MKILGFLWAAVYIGMPTQVFACRLALLLAVDISTSIDAREYALQRDGLANALVAPEVVTAFLASPDPVALAIFEWSGQTQQRLVLDWQTITSEGDLRGVANKVSKLDRSVTGYPTSLGNALAYASTRLSKAPACLRKTLDVSGDGRNNDGFPPASTYRAFDFSGVTVNALAIGGAEELAQLTEYFRTQVIRGPGAFVEIADDHQDFERAMRRKLEREVATRAVGFLEQHE